MPGPTIFTALWKQQGGRCNWCDRPMSDKPNHRANAPFGATFDHIIPLSKGGAKGGQNCVLACRKCNGDRGNGDAREFMFALQGLGVTEQERAA